MSYDFEIYCVEKPDPVQGPVGPGWQVLVLGPLIVEDEDVADDISAELPGIRYLIQMHIEGSVSGKVIAAAEKIAKEIARLHRGVIFDPQQGTIATPRGVKRYQSPADTDDASALGLSWFFLDDQHFAEEGADRLLELIKKRVPEALPRRYGLFEPPQHSLQRDGLDHFKRFLHENLRNSIVWVCTKPFDFVDIALPDDVGPSLRGFRCCRVTVTVSSNILTVAGWPLELKRFWLDAARIMEPFYAEIRGDSETGIRSWWWNGIPLQSPLAILVGPPYLELWPEFRETAEVLNGRWGFIDSLPGSPTKHEIPPPPEKIAQPPDERIERDPVTGEVLSIMKLNDIRYPEVWPFEGPRQELPNKRLHRIADKFGSR